jgi:CubicO group peptidase (beta-lactamase class C family)
MTTRGSRTWRILGALVAGLVLLGFSAWLLRPRPPRPPAAVTSVAQLDAYLKAITAFGAPPGLSLAVVQDGAPVYAKGFGLADAPRGRVATAETAYGWWSMTKIFTAAAVFQLEERGRLSLDDPVAAYLPFFRVTYPSPHSRTITIRHLLNHSSGLPNNVPALVGWIHHADQPPLDQTAYVASVLPRYSKLVFEPGDHGEYTNVGYMVLGAVIEAASGQPYEQYVREHLLQPLGMRRTDFVYTDAMGADVATASHPSLSLERLALPFLVDNWSSYVRETTHGRMWLNRFYANSAPPTGLIGPATDAARFVAAILAGGALAGERVLSERSVAAMLKDSHVPARHGEADVYPGTQYGLGWHIVPEGARQRVQHRGGGPGFGSEMRLYPAERLGMVVIANDTTYDRDAILDLAARIDWRAAAARVAGEAAAGAAVPAETVQTF